RKARTVAEEQILGDLKTVPTICQGYFDSQARARRAQLRSLAEEPGTKALLAEAGANAETFRDSAGDFAKTLGARSVFLFDPRGLLLGRSDRLAGEEAGRNFSQVSWVETPLNRLAEASASILELRGGPTFSIVASAPVLQGSGSEVRLNGVIAATFPISIERVVEISRLTRGETALLANVAARDAPPRIQIAAATRGLDDPSLAERLTAAQGVMDALFQRVEVFGPVEFSIPGGVFVGTLMPIRSGGGEPLGGVLVARSKNAEMAGFDAIQRHLLGTGLIVLVASLPLSYLLARGLTRPLRLLTEGAEKIGRGELEVRLPAAGGEVGALTRAFSSMVAELKEKAELEALIADMQRRPGDITWGRGPTSAGGDSPGLEVGGVFANRYEILSVLGEGGMGTVYRARDRELDDEIALKTLKPQAEDDGAAVERLRHEIKLARMITHPNVVRAHD
ncbi:MAG TPA: HAMP domain-containing protein, partial [Vicinamibacteria bacterium]|nr:HAMP domain-containing protein [Vicinamibacteria bacterium]